jgi:hypothetical protein
LFIAFLNDFRENTRSFYRKKGRQRKYVSSANGAFSIVAAPRRDFDRNELSAESAIQPVYANHALRPRFQRSVLNNCDFSPRRARDDGAPLALNTNGTSGLLCLPNLLLVPRNYFIS